MNPVLSRSKTGYRRYGRDDASPVFAPAPGTSRPTPAPVFSRKYENGRDETRERYGTVRDLSRPFSTLTLNTCIIHATISIPLDSTACPILKFKIENEIKACLELSKATSNNEVSPFFPFHLSLNLNLPHILKNTLVL
jgi:hypothetical protein